MYILQYNDPIERYVLIAGFNFIVDTDINMLVNNFIKFI